MFWQIFAPSPILLSIGSFQIRWYGLLVVLGLMAGYLIFWQLWHKSQRSVTQFEKLVFILVIVGFIGARILDIFLFEWSVFKNDPNLWWQVWYGGLSIHGGLLGGFLALLWYAKKHQDKLWPILDMLAPAVALGQAIGRWGNYFNQELFGLPTSLPWGIYIQPEFRPAQYILAEQFHPVFLYESLALAVIFIILWQMLKRPHVAGTVCLTYLILASLVRFVLEFIRVDEQLLILGLRSGMLISILLILLSLSLLIRQKFVLKKELSY